MYKMSVHTIVNSDTQSHFEKSKNHKKTISLTITSPNCQCGVKI